MSPSTNGCTGLPWRTSFEGCCNQHDIAYALGYSRSDADWILRECIKDQGKPVVAWIVWATVRTFGWCFWNKE
ncbi:RuvA C-terminal domain-containing protein [Pseudodesulfovibrio sediminis]|uniref:Uncharacterized protein n=1 Tax=Pseudodesulfovibrio sediminis TaxID=2810563 RepID=A0ABN6EUG2_9BACT|nr:RuvA C-terminal domain-containing protein [Pseudodesulfovibrio sediminis]BCS89956.1 hypothetical protein PSDVSF_31980 [Pseudodesulfovibrio sediminis]